MKAPYRLWQLIGFALAALIGTPLRFLYEWSQKSVIVAPFCPVNSSVWEHTKLLFMPLFFLALIESIPLQKHRPDFWCIKLKGILTALSLIPVLYYTYTGALGIRYGFVNVAIVFVALMTAALYENKLFKKAPAPFRYLTPRSSLTALTALFALYFLFTFLAPHIPLFEDPVTKGFGI